MNVCLPREHIYMNYTERNTFFINNYPLFLKICTQCAKNVRFKFPKIPYNDLLGYAFEGAITALDKVDLSNAAWMKFVQRYASGYAHSGALLMSGTQRVRTKEMTTYLSGELSTEARQLKKVVENEQKKDLSLYNDDFDEFLRFDEREWFLNLIAGSLEHAILVRLLIGQSIVDISNHHQISIRTLRRVIAQIKIAFQEAVDGHDVQNLITPIEDHPHKFLSLKVTGELLNMLEICTNPSASNDNVQSDDMLVRACV